MSRAVWKIIFNRILESSGTFGIMLVFITVTATAQVTVVVNKIPDTTPPDDTLYISGTFNDWNPRDPAFRLIKQNNGTYSATLQKGLVNFNYKITRGNWKTVEGDINGKKIEDRTFSLLSEKPLTHYVQVISWEDKTLFYNWDIVVSKTPGNTPVDAQIFISGNFNNWKVNDLQYRLTKLDDGTFAIKLPKTSHDTLQYKFHRGDWTSVESRKNGRMQYNRTSVWNKAQNSNHLACEIAAWEDMGGGTNVLFSFVLLASALQGAVMLLSMLFIHRRNIQMTNILNLLLFVSVVTLLARLATYNRFVFDWQPKLLLLSDFAYFLYAPLFYYFITGLSGLAVENRFLKWIFIAAPLLQLLFYARLVIMPDEQFILENIDGNFNYLFNGFSTVATAYNGFVYALCLWLLLKKYRNVKDYSSHSEFSLLAIVMAHGGVVMLIWIFSHLIFVLSPLFNFDGRILHEYSVDVLWMVFAISEYLHTFLLVRKPELFRVKNEPEEKQKSNFQKENLDTLKNALSSIMKKQKPYLNSKLGLQELAELMNVNIHTLSWIINDGYNKNFFDFINEHRIEEFKRLIGSDQCRNYTFLAIAMEVGFSSKTTFNRAFKKSTGKTPREFFNNVKDSQLVDIAE